MRDEAVVRTPSRAQVVLERHRHARKRLIDPLRAVAVDGRGALERPFGVTVLNARQRRVLRLDRRQRLPADLDGGPRARCASRLAASMTCRAG